MFNDIVCFLDSLGLWPRQIVINVVRLDFLMVEEGVGVSRGDPGDHMDSYMCMIHVSTC